LRKGYRGGDIWKDCNNPYRLFGPRWCQFFIDINPSDGTTALGSTQPLTEMSTRRISWG
jgi:hypothetical protein